MNKELLPKLKHKKEVFKRWMQGQGDPGEIQGHSKPSGIRLENIKEPRVESGERIWWAKRAST